MPMMTSQISKSMDFTKTQKSRYLKNKALFFFQIKKTIHTSRANCQRFIRKTLKCFSLNMNLESRLKGVPNYFRNLYLGKSDFKSMHCFLFKLYSLPCSILPENAWGHKCQIEMFCE